MVLVFKESRVWRRGTQDTGDSLPGGRRCVLNYRHHLGKAGEGFLSTSTQEEDRNRGSGPVQTQAWGVCVCCECLVSWNTGREGAKSVGRQDNKVILWRLENHARVWHLS